MYSSVLVTAPDISTAQRIGRSMVEKGLAACVNIWGTDSIYRWKGEVVQENEVAMLFKVSDAGFEALRSEISAVHPYEVPCIVRYAIADGHRPYLDWIGDNIRSSNPS